MGKRVLALGFAAVISMVALGCGGSRPEPLSPRTKAIVAEADPQMLAVLEQLHKDGGKSFSQVTVEQARSGPSAQQAAMEVAKREGIPTPQAVGTVDITSFSVRDGTNVSLQVYKPKGEGPWPVVVWCHGGGWVVGSVLKGNPYDSSCRALCAMANCVVVEPDYRLAPENPYPAAVNDCYDALRYVQEHTDKFSGRGQVAIGGESAGGNLCVAVGLMAIDKGTPQPSSIVSVYPVGGYYTDTPSAKRYAAAVPLDAPSLSWFYDRYVPNPDDRRARYFDVVEADLHGLPPTTVITDQIDPLNTDGRRLADSLRESGVTTHAINYDGVTHEFFGMGAVVDTAKQAELYAVQQLRAGWGM